MSFIYYSNFNENSLYYGEQQVFKLKENKAILDNKVSCNKNIPSDVKNGELFKIYNEYEDVRAFNKNISKKIHSGSYGPDNIYLIRHAEKFNDCYYLNKNGIFRSSLLPKVIENINNSGHPIDYIVTCNPNLKGDSIHVQQSATFGSWIMNIPLFIFGSQKQNTELVENIYTIKNFNKKNILIVWDHTCIQALMKNIIEKGVEVKKIQNYKFVNPFGNSGLPYWSKNNFNTIYHLDKNLKFTIGNLGINTCFKDRDDKVIFGKKQICNDED